MNAIIRDNSNGEIQSAIDSIVKRSVELQLGLLAPCLVDGHENNHGQLFYIVDTNGQDDFYTVNRKDGRPIHFTICSRCKLVFAEDHL